MASIIVSLVSGNELLLSCRLSPTYGRGLRENAVLLATVSPPTSSTVGVGGYCKFRAKVNDCFNFVPAYTMALVVYPVCMRAQTYREAAWEH